VDASPRPARRAGQRRPRLRHFLTGAIALAALLPASASAASTTARTAASFVDSIGVNTHTYYDDTAYHDRFDTVAQRLRELGVRHVRENLMPDRPDQYEMLNELAAAGIKSTLILGSPEDGSSGLKGLTSILDSDLHGSVDAVEGPNEYDLFHGGPNWMSELASYQSQLYSTVKSDPSLSALPVLGPSLGNTNSDGSDVSGALDYGNIHSYPNAEPPEDNVSRLLATATEMSGSKPVLATETGYHTALNWSGDHKPASEAAQATYMPRLFLEYFRRGIVRTFSYELLDEFPDPNREESESNFGLLRNDLSPKPAFTALRNLISILADPGPAFTPGSLGYTVSGDQDDLHQMLLAKRDGSYYLALWRADSVWDNESRTPLNAPAGAVRVNFSSALTSAAEYAPNSSDQPLRSLPTAGGPLSVDVGAQVVIVKLTTAGRTVGSIKAWVSKRAVESGSRVAVKGKLTGAASGPTPVTIQRWQKGWRTVAKARTSANGNFRKLVRLTGRPQAGPSRIRVIAPKRAKPSNQVRVKILPRGTGGAAAVAAARELG
jgi:hypothetical protein